MFSCFTQRIVPQCKTHASKSTHITAWGNLKEKQREKTAQAAGTEALAIIIAQLPRSHKPLYNTIGAISRRFASWRWPVQA